ncbi:MAG: hypothetical protein ABR888_04725 [Thermoplasmata archaeon]
MKSHPQPPRNRLVGLAVAVSLIMLGAAALASVVPAAVPGSSSVVANGPSTITILTVGSAVSLGSPQTISLGSIDGTPSTNLSPSSLTPSVAAVVSIGPTLPAPLEPAASSAIASAPSHGSGSVPSRSPTPESGDPPTAGAVTPTNPLVDSDQLPITLTANPSGGTAPYTFQWFWDTATGVVTNGDLCEEGTSMALGVGSTQATGSEITGPGAYYYCYNVTDSASQSASSSWDLVTVNSAMTAPAAPSPSATALDFDQALTVSGTLPTTGTPTYSWQWWVSVNSGTYTAATHCSQNSGTGASGGTPVTCVIAGNTLTITDSYTFELKATDSASTPDTQTSLPSSSVIVSSALTTSAAPTVSAAKLDVNQTLTVTAITPGTGTQPYSWQWWISVNSSAYVVATQCATNAGSGATGTTQETCSIAAGTLAAGGTYAFKFQVTDSASSAESTTTGASSTVAVKSALTAPAAPTPSPPSPNAGSVLTVTGTVPSTGTSTYSYQWLISIKGGPYGPATQCGSSGAGSGAAAGSKTCTIPGNTLTANTSYNFELEVTDSASSPETMTSPPSVTVTTTTALTAGTPTPTTTILDNGQSVTLNANPSGGTAPYTFQWYSGTTAAGCTGLASPITGAIFSSYLASPTSSKYYCYTVTDTTSTTAPSATALVTVNSALQAPGQPVVSATVLDSDQGLTVTGTIPSTGSPNYQYEWLYSVGSGYNKATMCAKPSNSGVAGGTPETCTIAVNVLTAGDTYTFELLVNDSASTPETMTSQTSSGVAVSLALTAPNAPTPTSPKLDVNQTLTVTGKIPSTGTPTYTWQWLVEVNGAGGFVSATQCGSSASGSGAPSGATETCTIPASTLIVGDSYTFKLRVTDSATSPETATSAVSAAVAVKSALTAPAAPTANAALLDANQALSVTGTIPSTGTTTYQYEWLYSTGSGYSKATMCAKPSNSGVAGGTLETCAIAVNVLTVGDTYTFELRVNDSATTPESMTSLASSGVAVSLALTVPTTPAPTSPKLDVNQTLTVTGTIPTTGSPTYTWQWMVQVNGTGGYVAAAQCGSSASGSGALPGALETCTIPASTLIVGDFYNFKLKVTDSATNPEFATSLASAPATVKSALTAAAAPTTNAALLDVDQGLTVTGTIPLTGSPNYQYEWLYSVGSGYSKATMCGTPSNTSVAANTTETCTIADNLLTAGDTYTFELLVNDSATTPESVASVGSSPVTVSLALTPPGTPTPSATWLDSDQTMTVTGAIPATGTPSYSWQWLVEVNGAGGYAVATQCGSSASGSGASVGALETCTILGGNLTAGDSYTFALEVTDGAQAPETATSLASSSMTVSSPLTTPIAPTPSVTTLDADQPLTVTGTIPTTGSPTYSWQWLIEVNGVGGYAAATQCGSSATGSGAVAGALVTCTVSANTLTASTSYTFELEVMDGATTPEVQVSTSSVTVATSSTLTAGAPTPTSPTLDDGQSLLLMANPSGGSGENTFQWYWGSSAAACLAYDNSIPGATSLTYLASPASNTYYCYVVTDSNFDAADSAAELVAVNVALSAPALPTVIPTLLDADQAATTSVTVTGTIPSTGTPTYSWQWLVSVNGGTYVPATQCALSSGGGASEGVTETCLIAAGELITGDSYTFEFQVTDSATASETTTSVASSAVTVSPRLTAPGAPASGATALDADQTLTVTGTIPTTGTPNYSWQWLISIQGAPYINATQCAVNSGSGASAGATETCRIAASAWTVGDNYTFELTVTDSASTPEIATSSPSSTVTASSTLTAPTALALSATVLDADQVLTVTGATPSTGTSPYSWQWLVSVNGGPYGPTTLCVVSSGGGASGGAPETCSISGATLTASDSYLFELKVTDSASSPEALVSSASSAVSVSSALAAGTLSPTSPSIDSGQTVTLTAGPSGGSGAYTYQWYSGSTASTCTSLGSLISGATLATYPASPTSTTYYCYVVTDSATFPESETSSSSPVVVSPALTAPAAPTLSTTALDADQVLTVTATTPSSGTSTYSWQWLVEVNGAGGFVPATQCGAAASGTEATGGILETCTIPESTLSPGNAYAFELQVTDSATTPETQSSAASSTVTVSSALTAPTAPAVSATSVSAGQALTVTGTIPSTGTPPYSWQWLISINGGAFAPATQCAVNSGTGASGGAAETCSVAVSVLTVGTTYAFELQVTDSVASPETQTSTATSPVAVTASTPSSSSSGFWTYAGIGLGALVVVILASLVLLARRRRSHPGAAPPVPPEEAEPTPATGVGPSVSPPAPVARAEVVPYASPAISPMRVPTSSEPEVAALAAALVAVPMTHPPSPSEPTPITAPAIEPKAGDEEDLDIDSVLAELDAISGQILKPEPKKGAGTPPPEVTEGNAQEGADR